MSGVFAPEFFSIAPPLMDFEQELIWFNLTESFGQKVEYDKSNHISTNARELMDLAFVQPLNLQDQKLLLNELSKNPFFVYQIRLTPDKVTFFPQFLAVNAFQNKFLSASSSS